MLADAFSRSGQPIRAALIEADEWERMKGISQNDPDAFVMGCCQSRAVLKTSPNGLQFFAHFANECASAPETTWHLNGKDACIGALKALGIAARSEVPGKEVDGSRWEADVFFEHNGRKVVIELQRSYQHFREFMRRQELYSQSQVECYWLLREEVARPLMKSIRQLRLKVEFGGKVPKSLFFPVLPNLPWAVYQPEQDQTIRAPGLSMSLEHWITAIANDRWMYDGTIWSIQADTGF